MSKEGKKRQQARAGILAQVRIDLGKQSGGDVAAEFNRRVALQGVETTSSGKGASKSTIIGEDGKKRVLTKREGGTPERFKKELGEVPEPVVKETAVQPGPLIKLKPNEKEKTGISKLREEDSVIGAAVRIATDWRTTVALVATLATIATLGGGVGVGAGAGAGGRITHTVSALGKTQTAQRAIVGKPAVSGVQKLFRAGANFAINPKSKALTTSMITKVGMSVGAAALVATTVGTYPFANFELAEATDKIGIAMFQAAKAGDVEEVARLQEYLEEMVNPSVWDSVMNKIPFVNVLNNVKKNVAAAQVSAKSILKSAETELEKARLKEDEPTFEEERIAGEERARERELERREEDEKYWEKHKEEAEERKADERLADEKYWDDIYKRNQKRKADEREADEAYWAKIKGSALDDEDKKIIDDWNKGRSALNFKWLGL